MPKPPAKAPSNQRPVSPQAIEHDRQSVLRMHTAWHHFLARALEKTKARGLDFHCFVRLGTLPIEADVIVLRLDEGADIAEFAKYFGFLVPALRRYLILEYKSPDDRLTLDDFDTVRAYAMLCKRKYQAGHDGEVAVAMLYSRTETDFFADCARNGFPFVEQQPGVRQSCQLPMGFYAIDLVAIGERQPDHPINLLSARRRDFGGAGVKSNLGPFGVLYEEVFLRELKKMGQLHVPGYTELLDDARKFILEESSIEQRLQGIPAEDRLRGLSQTELARLRELLLKQENR